MLQSRLTGVACTGFCCCHCCCYCCYCHHLVTRFYAVSWRELAGVVSVRMVNNMRVKQKCEESNNQIWKSRLSTKYSANVFSWFLFSSWKLDVIFFFLSKNKSSRHILRIICWLVKRKKTHTHTKCPYVVQLKCQWYTFTRQSFIHSNVDIDISTQGRKIWKQSERQYHGKLTTHTHTLIQSSTHQKYGNIKTHWAFRVRK